MSEHGNGPVGEIRRVAGAVVEAGGMPQVRLYDLVRVGEAGLIGEVIRLDTGRATIQVYETSSGLRAGEPVESTGAPLVVQLGPGLLGQTYDGLQRPLDRLLDISGRSIRRGVAASALPPEQRWTFEPAVEEGTALEPGEILGHVAETEEITHHIMLPPGLAGRVTRIEAGDYTIDEPIAVVETEEGAEHAITLVQRWPVRQARPSARRLPPREPLVTGTRVLDAFFPVAKGGAAIVPGGFGTGKTVLEQQLARWSDADIVIYVGCGERGNEMAEVLEEFPEITDPHTGRPLMERTILIANTSNMPVAAREASIYTGVTMAEYYRDMGYDVLMLADSTSRWGEALREISARLEEIPGEEGYPAYLTTRLAAFYERSGRVVCLGGGDGEEERRGSVTLAGAVSPPGGDFSEPITQNSMRVTGTLWALDYDLSRRRHFPAVSWSQSYTLYELEEWYAREVSEEWGEVTGEAMRLLQRADELEEIVRLVGPEALPATDRLVLQVAEMVRENFLQQSAFDEVDRYSPLRKSFLMLKADVLFYRRAAARLEAGWELEEVTQLPVVERLARMKEIPDEEAPQALEALLDDIREALAEE